MEKGISIDEACARNVIGTREDFERNCNPDGTVKTYTDTTTFSLKNSGSSVTINNTYLQIGGAVTVIAVIVLLALVIKKLKRRSK